MTDPNPPHPELSSLAGALEELTSRIRTMGEDADRAGDDPVATELFEIERSLQTAGRRLARLADTTPA